MLTMASKGSDANDCPLPPGSRVAGYFRDSGGDEQERSVDQQRRVAEEYCQQHHLVLVKLFADEARPGSTIVGRDAFDNLIHYCRQLAPSAKRRAPDAPDGILLWDLKRFARDRQDNAFFKAIRSVSRERIHRGKVGTPRLRRWDGILMAQVGKR